MALDKPKRPGAYPQAFHRALELAVRAASRAWPAEAPWVECQVWRGQGDALREARRFRAFVKGLRCYPLHPSARWVEVCQPRTRVQETFPNVWSLEIAAFPAKGLSPNSEQQFAEAISSALEEIS